MKANLFAAFCCAVVFAAGVIVGAMLAQQPEPKCEQLPRSSYEHHIWYDQDGYPYAAARTEDSQMECFR